MMWSVIILSLLAGSVVALLAFLAFLYRFLTRRRLFPQLPRIWRGDRTRSLIFLLLFMVFMAGFFGVSLWAPAGPPQPPAETATASQRPPITAPSFDGQPPPQPGPAAPASASAQAGEQRVLPPAGQTQAAAAPQAAPPAPQPAPETQTAGAEVPAAPAAPAAAVGASQAAAPETPPAAGQAATQPSQPAQAQAQAAAPPQAPPPAAQEASPQPKEQAPAPAAAQPQPKAEPSPKAAPKPAPKPEAKPKAKPAPKPAPAGPRYTICAASFRNLRVARRYAAGLKDKGLAARVVEADLGAKGRWYRVCVGSYPTPGRAQNALKKLGAKNLGDSPFITRLR